jgi:hypothetical protein
MIGVKVLCLRIAADGAETPLHLDHRLLIRAIDDIALPESVVAGGSSPARPFSFGPTTESVEHIS